MVLLALALSIIPPAARPDEASRTTPTAEPSTAISVEDSTPGFPSGASPETPPAAWRPLLRRFHEINQAHQDVRAQQEAVRRRMNQTGPMGERARARVAQRLHELDTEERETRHRRLAFFAEIAERGETLRTLLEGARTDLLAQKATARDPHLLESLETQLSHVNTLLRHFEELEERRSGRFPPGTRERREWPPRHGHPSLREPRFPPRDEPTAHGVAERIRALEAQVLAMRSRLADLEDELEDLKRAVADPPPHSLDTETSRDVSPRDPPTAPEAPTALRPGPGRWRHPDGERQRPPPMPRRDPIPPAGFAPGAVPGLEPDVPRSELDPMNPLAPPRQRP